MSKNNPFLVLFFILISPLCFSQTKIPSFFSNDMILQQKESVSIWGTDAPNVPLEIETSWGEKSKTTADANGIWKTKIPTIAASFTKHTITIKGTTTISLENVLLGEIWFCSGQSNMEMQMKALNKNPTQKSEELISTSLNTNIRLFNSEHNTSLSLENDVIGKWEEANPESVSKFSAVGYLFGKTLFEKLQIPIGIIEASWGGTSIECWLPQKNILEYPEIKIPTSLYKDQEKEKKPKPTLLYNAMIHPFRDFSIKGFLWYQGEGNRNNGSYYKKYMQTLISSWRDQWQQKALPFYFVQIAPFDYNTKYKVKTATFGANLVREAQVFAAQEIVNTGLVVSTDAGKCNDIHPTQKNIIAERLANWALAKQYNFKEIVYRSPEYKGITIKKNNAIIAFNFFGNKNENNKLDTKKELKDFVIAGEDKVFYAAKVKINKNQTLTVYSDMVEKPVAVRYGFVDCLEGSLFSNSGLPVSPFRTDDWQE